MADFEHPQFDKMAPGTTSRFSIPVGKLANGAPVEIPCIVASGTAAGPLVWINGQVHGDEINGVVAGVDFVRGLDTAQLKGTIVVSPTANPLALVARAKKAPQDDLDIDQSYPGNPNGLLSDRMAAAFFAVASQADVLVNMHTMGTPFNSKPYAVYKLHPNGPEEQDLLRLIRWFRPAIACRMSVAGGTGELPGNLAGALDYQMLERGKTAFMVELGGGGRIDEGHVSQGVRGLRGMCAELGMLADRDADDAPINFRRATRRHHVMCSGAGIFRAAVEPGGILPAGAPLGTIVDLCGEPVETVRFSQDVFLIGVRRDPVVHSGERVAFVATEWIDA